MQLSQLLALPQHEHAQTYTCIEQLAESFSGAAQEGIINTVCCTSDCFVYDVAVDFLVLDVCMHAWLRGKNSRYSLLRIIIIVKANNTFRTRQTVQAFINFGQYSIQYSLLIMEHRMVYMVVLYNLLIQIMSSIIQLISVEFLLCLQVKLWAIFSILCLDGQLMSTLPDTCTSYLYLVHQECLE